MSRHLLLVALLIMASIFVVSAKPVFRTKNNPVEPVVLLQESSSRPHFSHEGASSPSFSAQPQDAAEIAPTSLAQASADSSVSIATTARKMKMDEEKTHLEATRARLDALAFRREANEKMFDVESDRAHQLLETQASEAAKVEEQAQLDALAQQHESMATTPEQSSNMFDDMSVISIIAGTFISLILVFTIIYCVWQRNSKETYYNSMTGNPELSPTLYKGEY